MESPSSSFFYCYQCNIYYVNKKNLSVCLYTYGDGGRGVYVDDGAHVGAGSVDGAVQREAGLVDAQRGGARVQNLPLHVHLDQAGRRDLRVQQPKRVDQEVLMVHADTQLWMKKTRNGSVNKRFYDFIYQEVLIDHASTWSPQQVKFQSGQAYILILRPLAK